jgi:hypothetical protein
MPSGMLFALTLHDKSVAKVEAITNRFLYDFAMDIVHE